MVGMGVCFGTCSGAIYVIIAIISGLSICERVFCGKEEFAV
jgi:hypothetical protein